MGRTTKFREQHDEMLSITSEIKKHLNIKQLSNDANEVRSLLSRLLGKLSVHLAMEDKSLYPSLFEHSDERVKSMAKRYSDEMGGIAGTVNTYKNQWLSSSKIQDNPSEFINQTKGLFGALAKRIERENAELYKMVDEM